MPLKTPCMNLSQPVLHVICHYTPSDFFIPYMREGMPNELLNIPSQWFLSNGLYLR